MLKIGTRRESVCDIYCVQNVMLKILPLCAIFIIRWFLRGICIRSDKKMTLKQVFWYFQKGEGEVKNSIVEAIIKILTSPWIHGAFFNLRIWIC